MVHRREAVDGGLACRIFSRREARSMRRRMAVGGIGTGDVTSVEFTQATTDLQNPSLTVVASMTVAAWGSGPW